MSLTRKIRCRVVNWVRRVVDFLSQHLVPVMAPIFSRVARSGVGSDWCLRWGFLPMPVHFYSPVPDLADLEHRKVWDHRSELAGIVFNPEGQVVFLEKLGEEFGNECDWSSNSDGVVGKFYTENGSFSYGCAAGVHSVIRQFEPKHVIEIGSGQSSLIISGALALNGKDTSRYSCEYNVIDPFPLPITEKGLGDETHIIKQRVESLNLGFFDQLDENDVLFIDSGHTVRIGSDVNFLILDVLPRLAPGVIVHFHDIGLPSEYPKVYATNPNFRVFWTEAYLLQAFLCFNREFEILMAMSYLMTERKEAFRKAFPHYNPVQHKAISGSFWIRRKMKRDL